MASDVAGRAAPPLAILVQGSSGMAMLMLLLDSK